MIAISNKRRKGGDKKGSRGKGVSQRRERTALSMYSAHPGEEITLTDFEELATLRLSCLKAIEAFRAKGLKGAQYQTAIDNAVDKWGLRDPYTDRVSHHILRLAYCRSEDLRRWFATQETELFRARFHGASDGEVDRFFSRHKLEYEPVNVGDIDPGMRSNLKVSYADRQDPNSWDYYRIPFEEALELVKRRQVFLNAGFAFVSKRDMVTIVTARFRSSLSKQLAGLYRLSQNLKQDMRVAPLIANLSRQHIGPSYKATQFSGAVTKDQIPLLAERSFPMCMDHSYTRLKEDSHMKHGGRMQFGLFLKGIGLSLQDALDFWRMMFQKKTPHDQFVKKYAYNIRHNYGKEGKRTSYTPYSCMKIIQSPPGVGDAHGCPFKHFDEKHLRAKLRSKKTGLIETDDIMQLVKGSHYQLACQRYFAAMHNGHEAQVNHPNNYFDESVAYYNELNNKKQNGGKAGKQVLASKENQQPAPKPVTADMEIDAKAA